MTEKPITVAFTAALDHERGSRIAIEMVPGSYATIPEFDEACERETERKDSGLYSLMVLPLAEAKAFAEALRGFLEGLEDEEMAPQGMPGEKRIREEAPR
ncbi:hypothetical protein H8E65_01085 [Candidatus Bathyarchaeota archaeon]|nr:hypothetical protein [Candidatus Bathyarchaeota archaeon]MBL7080096.1 hypothetical protein [Candidatus Bathyarchaeota archaeon]